MEFNSNYEQKIMTDLVSYERNGSIVVIAIENGAVNALSQEVRSALWQAVERFDQDDVARAAVIMGAGRMFVGGADIKEFGKPPLEPTLPELINRIEVSTKPIVAAMHGVSLGGGLELALGCHYRLAMPSTKLGLPEVTLGLLPGAGGTQRVTRLAGVEKALDFILPGTPVTEATALTLGLIDRIGEGSVRSAGITFANEVLSADKGARRVSELPKPAPDRDAVAAARTRLGKTAHGQIAPFFVVDAIEAATRLPFKDAIAEERRLFLELMQTPQRAGLVHAFFLERKVSQLRELSGIAPRNLSTIGVVGGGTMGAGIATAALLAGYDVCLIERDESVATAAQRTIDGNLAAAVKRGKLSEVDRENLLSRKLLCATNYGALSEANLVIEAVYESMDVKKEVFARLDEVMKPGAVLATNTSYLDVNEMASVTSRPGDVVGLHFFSPAHVMRLLEVVVTDSTLPDVTATAFAFGKKLGKVSVRSGVCDGFIGNRILTRFRGAADRMVLAGASPYQVDRAIVNFGFPMGPYAVADLAGLDIGFLTRKRKAADRDPRDIIPVWADELYHMGRLGQKAGRGYYIYQERGRSGEPDDEVNEIIARCRAAKGVVARNFGDDEIQRQYMAAMVNEAARVVDEKIAARPLDVDAVLLFGYGFPRHRGGPMHWADSQGLSGLLADIQTWAKEDEFFWSPAPLLERLVAENSTFSSLNG
ncbi:3-hydroxyacyl-CoA dehydrogenase NAD-binding domain-containing protein [Mesorhizobium sp. WSM4887]|uniref:3-hydroxyacyl-CoA dehydrogenase NAD-binding domain-containing protein n=1 Tax=Mesorhizobium sp. WSM4887 TaxID=3038543 RepID=UPI0024179157|nr:3-hydroxyacyl-CoA dehydrogenase NAD-binding domain-containing protein [Mesorhizobium sp. WSM4887]MDG4886823.1 3-hydroxyacyl-CoA dehydrogenase NAD-binding domain-containing protein [Mesorhizobium sp. WSM4887]